MFQKSFVKTDEDSVDETVPEAVPSADERKDVVADPVAITYEDFLNVEEDIAVCGEITCAEIIAEVLESEKQDDREVSGEGDAGTSTEEILVPSSADVMNHVNEAFFRADTM
uniref:Uncharacterized protein n=1 Tax=Homalodisca liturata TaxID=320908 RepID=A0A1B6JQK2_9HEMI